MRLAGKTALVTGGAGGIGRAICQRFASEGADVVSASLSVGGPVDGVRDIVMDVSDEDSVRAGVAALGWQRLDVLVNNAGIEMEKTIEDTSLDEWNEIFGVNVTGTFLVSKHSLPLLRAAGGASVINLGSYDGFIADPKLAAYCATKGAVHALTKAMAVDHGPEGIRVNAICPGFIDTPMLAQFLEGKDEARQLVDEAHPIGRMGQPEDVANLALWLASDEAGYATGQLWVIDGGVSAQIAQVRL